MTDNLWTYAGQLLQVAACFAPFIVFFCWVKWDAERAMKAKHGRHYH